VRQPKPLFIATAAFEVVTGLALATVPSMLAGILLGTPIDSAGGLVIARVAGAALISIGAVCWLARNDHGRAVNALLVGLLIYNTIVATVLAHASLVLNLTGIGLWPACVAHAALVLWCIACLRAKSVTI
jgi:hypothetical protein